MNILEFDNFYLVGIKGVGMAALASCLVDAQKNVSGCDVKENFVTQDQLTNLEIKIDEGFNQLPSDTQIVVYTAAHGASQNPIVIDAKKRGLTVVSHAQALASIFNQQAGIAVAGVGGKTTISAMLSFIFEHNRVPVSYLVGVGGIPGLAKTGQWTPDAKWFVAEADDYSEDPFLAQRGDFRARFSYLKPEILVVTKIKYDHPDVYQSFEQTKQTFLDLFKQVRPNGIIFCHEENRTFVDDWIAAGLETTIRFYGQELDSDIVLNKTKIENNGLVGSISIEDEEYELKLNIPGLYNLENAMIAMAVAKYCELSSAQILEALAAFKSTKRRFEHLEKQDKLEIYDDYAHHPHEVKAAIESLELLYPNKKNIIAFQPHTYSRTKELFTDFVASFANVEHLVLLDIFASARESTDPEISSDMLAEGIEQAFPKMQITRLTGFQDLKNWIKENSNEDAVLLTLGAGDIYLAHHEG